MQETMLQEVMMAPREIRFDRVPVPTAGPGQVLVKIKRIGICGSDIHVYHGKHPYTKYPGHPGPRGLRPGRGAGGGSHPIPGGSAGDH